MAEKETKAAKFTYPVLGKLRCDGEKYDAGDTVELTETQAAPLIANSTIGAAIVGKAAASTK